MITTKPRRDYLACGTAGAMSANDVQVLLKNTSRRLNMAIEIVLRIWIVQLLFP